MIRLGVPPYLNCLPLVYGFPCEIYKNPPSTLIQKAKEDDIILAPIVAAFLDPEWYVLEGVGIGSLGPVHTVKLFLQEECITIQNIKRIYIDSDSQTSRALLKVLLVNVYQRNLKEIEFLQGSSEKLLPLASFEKTGSFRGEPQNALFSRPDKGHIPQKVCRGSESFSQPARSRNFSEPSQNKNEKVQGALLIGDKVWDYSNYHAFLDLGQCWSEWTKLPFVYACWMTKNLVLAKEWKEKLISQARKNLEVLEKISQEIAPNDAAKILNYWKTLCFELGPLQKNGIALFHSLWAEIENRPILKLRWI